MTQTFVTQPELDCHLKHFKLEEHGDRNERQFWPLVRDDFPHYEILWRQYVVPLTRRLEYDLPPAVQIRFRHEMKEFERFAMSHYSVFYFFARATARLACHHDEDQLANDVFYLMGTSLDNVKTFLKQLHHLDLIDGSFPFTDPKQDNKFPGLREIADYRNALVHDPVLGRAVDRGVEMMPAHDELSKASKSWLYCESLPTEKLINTRTLIKRYRLRYAVYLDTRWRDILSLLDKSREKFVRRLLLPIPVGVSGQFVPNVEARSNRP